MFFGLFNSPKRVTESQDSNELIKQFISSYQARVKNSELLLDYQNKFTTSEDFQLDYHNEILFNAAGNVMSELYARHDIVLYHLALMSKLIFCNPNNLNQNSVLFSLVKTILYAIKNLGFNNSSYIENGNSALICAFLFEHDESTLLKEVKWFKKNKLLENVLLKFISFLQGNLSQLSPRISSEELEIVKQNIQYSKGVALFWNNLNSDIFDLSSDYKNISKYNNSLWLPGKDISYSHDFIIFSLIKNGVRIYNNNYNGNAFWRDDALNSGDKLFVGPVFVLETTYDQIHKNIIVWGIQTDDRRELMMSLDDSSFELFSMFVIKTLNKFDPEFFADDEHDIEDMHYSNKRTYYLLNTPLFFYLNNNSHSDALFIPHDGCEYLRGSSQEIYEQIGI